MRREWGLDRLDDACGEAEEEEAEASMADDGEPHRAAVARAGQGCFWKGGEGSLKGFGGGRCCWVLIVVVVV